MLNKNELVGLIKAVVKANPSQAIAYSCGDKQYSYDTLNETLRREFNEIAGTYADYRENKNTLFALIETALNEVLPKKVLEQYGAFAEVKTFAQGDKPVFTRKLGKNRAKQFITKVGLAGIYEVFKLGSEAIEVTTTAYGGAAQIGLEEFLGGKVDFAELTTILFEGMDEAVYKEIASALIATVGNLPTANKHVQSGNEFEEAAFDKLIAVADAYGPATIYCTFEFAATIAPADKWISDAMRDNRWANGYFTTYKGHKVVILPQSFEDEKNDKKVIDPSYCWIIPGGDAKPVKIAFEGSMIVDEYVNADRSREIQAYQKFGVATIATNDIAVYRNANLAK